MGEDTCNSTSSRVKGGGDTINISKGERQLSERLTRLPSGRINEVTVNVSMVSQHLIYISKSRSTPENTKWPRRRYAT